MARRPLPTLDAVGRRPVVRYWFWKADVLGEWYQQEFQYFNMCLGRMEGLRLAWFVRDTDTVCSTAVSHKSVYYGATHNPQTGWCRWHGRFTPIWSPSPAIDIEFDYDGRPEQLFWFQKHTYVISCSRDPYWDYDGTDYQNRKVRMRATTAITCVDGIDVQRPMPVTLGGRPFISPSC